MWHQKAKGPPDGPPIFLIFVEKLNCPQSQAYQSISPVGTGLSLTDRALEVSLGTSIGNYSPLIAPQPVKLKIHRWRHRAGSSPATGTSGKLPLPSRTPHFVGCVFFCACAGTGIYFVTWTHVGTSYARSDFLWNKKSVTRFTVPPFPQKITLRLRCSLASALTTLRLASNFLRVSTTVICRYLF